MYYINYLFLTSTRISTIHAYAQNNTKQYFLKSNHLKLEQTMMLFNVKSFKQKCGFPRLWVTSDILEENIIENSHLMGKKE